jgi:lipopolysaccharide export system permease protein
VIIIRYLVREIFKSQIAILFILLLIFFCQKLVRILGAAVDGQIPTNLVMPLLGLGVPDMAQLILPLSLFLGLLMTLGRLYTDSEITVMQACGLGKRPIITAALILAVFTAVLAAFNTFWIGPWSARYQQQVLADAKANPAMATMVEGQFQQAQNGSSVMFIGDVTGKSFEKVFLAQLRTSGSQRPSVVVADKGHVMVRDDGAQVITLNQGTRYEGTAMMRDFRITDFVNYIGIIGHQDVAIDASESDQLTFTSLWNSSLPDARGELHWRLTLIISVFIMALLVIPLSVVNPRQGRVISMLPAILLYLVFFLLQSSLRSNAAKGGMDPMVWIWSANLFYFALAVFLNLWDSLPMRKVRSRIKGVA